MIRLTLDSLRSLVHRELDRDPGQSTYESLINEAGEAWVELFEWPYLRDRTQRLKLEAGVESYRLGLGVRAIAPCLYRANPSYGNVPVVDFQAWFAAKDRDLASGGLSCEPIATTHWGTREGDKQPRLYLEVYPATLSEEVSIQYQAGWLPMDKAGDVADVPGPLTQSFREFLRRYTSARETDKTSVDEVLANFMRGPQGQIAKRAAAQHTGRIVSPTGGVGEAYNRRSSLRGRRRRYGPFSQSDYLRHR